MVRKNIWNKGGAPEKWEVVVNWEYLVIELELWLTKVLQVVYE